MWSSTLFFLFPPVFDNSPRILINNKAPIELVNVGHILGVHYCLYIDIFRGAWEQIFADQYKKKKHLSLTFLSVAASNFS